MSSLDSPKTRESSFPIPSSPPPPLPDKHGCAKRDGLPPQLPRKNLRRTEEELNQSLGITARKNSSAEGASFSQDRIHQTDLDRSDRCDAATKEPSKSLSSVSECEGNHPATVSECSNKSPQCEKKQPTSTSQSSNLRPPVAVQGEKKQQASTPQSSNSLLPVAVQGETKQQTSTLQSSNSQPPVAFQRNRPPPIYLPSASQSSPKSPTILHKEEPAPVLPPSSRERLGAVDLAPKAAPRTCTQPVHSARKLSNVEGAVCVSPDVLAAISRIPNHRSTISSKVVELQNILPTSSTTGSQKPPAGAMPTPFLAARPLASKEDVDNLTSAVTRCEHTGTRTETNEKLMSPKTRTKTEINEKLVSPKKKEFSPFSDENSPFEYNPDAGFESEDYLSEGDWCDDPEFSLPSTPIICKSIPIVAAQKHLLTEKKGYLFKYTRPSKRGSQQCDDSQQSGKINKLRDELQKRWQKRWVTVDENSLKYYSNSKSVVSKGIIPICTMKNVEQDIKDSSDTHAYRFRILTSHRVYYFATENVDDLSLWSSILMRAIIEAKKTLLHSSPEECGDMSSPNMMGYAKMEGRRRFLAIKQGKFCFYASETDFKQFSPIHEVELQLGNAKDIGKCRLQLNTPQVAFVFTFETQEELNSWKSAFEAGILFALGDDKVLKEVYQNQSNRFCADCGAENPEWAAINIGVTVCHNCAGIHRRMANAKVRSLLMDSKVWTTSLVKFFQSIGNLTANKFWESKITEEDRINPDTDINQRSQFIQRKYHEKQFCELHPLHDQPADLNELLRKSVQKNDIQTTMQLLFSGADVTYADDKHKTPYQLAENAHNHLLMEFLFQNGGENCHHSLCEGKDGFGKY